MKFDVLGVGNALVDETFYVEKSFLDTTELFFNQFKSISYQDQEDILSGLPSDSEPDVVCGGSTTNSLAATSNFGSNCAHICQLANDERGKLYENNLKEILMSKDRRNAGPTAPADGLYLEKIIY